jgi:uncharacterized membrane protein YphA (DoxX/SURF4 family)
MADPWASLALIARITVAVVFGAAAITKLRDPAAFATGLLDYEIVSPAQARMITIGLPATELGLALAFATGWQVWICALVTCGLLAVFSLAILRSLLRGRRFRCNCFGGARGDYIGWESVARNFALMCLAVLASIATLFSKRGSFGVAQTVPVEDWLAIVLAVAFLLLVLYFIRYMDLIVRARLPSEGQRRPE